MPYRIVPALMSGGAGTRLWPVSTDDAPKQFHALAGAHSLFTQTLLRFRDGGGDLEFAPPLALCGAGHVAAVSTSFAEAGMAPTAIIVEPEARNTAALGAVAALAARDLEPDALVLLVPSDHIIADDAAFRDTLARAAPYAKGRIVTFGIKPDRPATGYGYIKQGRELGAGVFELAAFKEKPDTLLAREYVAEGRYHWNSGMFLFDPQMVLGEFSAHSDDAHSGILRSVERAWADASRHADVVELGSAFGQSPSVPFDIAMMEKTQHGAVAPCDIGWNDIGAWDEVWRVWKKDDERNAVRGKVALRDAQDNLVVADGVTVCASGIENLIIVATKDAVLVVPREKAQDVKALKELAAKL